MKYLLPMLALGFFLAACNASTSTQSTYKPESGGVSIATLTDQPINLLAFGSCSREDLPQTLWDDVLADQPDVWVWMGDNIYANSTSMVVMAQKYAQQKADSNYQLLRNLVPIVGTWDDHDYGSNDGGKNYTLRDSAQQLALDFLDVPAQAPVRSRQGMYQSFDLGEGDQKVRLILLDTRYHRDTLMPDTLTPHRYIANEQGDVLGEEQWAWLRAQLNDSPARVHIIGSSIQVLSSEHFFEKWSNFPAARERLLSLLEEEQVANPVFLSGDRHIAEVSRLEMEELASPVFDFTSSGLTHTWPQRWSEENPYRVGEMVIALNYGLIQFNWEQGQMKFLVKGDNGAILLEQAYPIK